MKNLTVSKRDDYVECSKLMDLLKQLVIPFVGEIVRHILNENEEYNQTFDTNDKDKLLDIDEVCTKIKKKRGTVYNLRKEGVLKPDGYSGKSPLFKESTVDKYLFSNS